MKAFRFSLEAVRKLRRSQEQSAQQALAEALQQREEALKRLADLEAEQLRAWSEHRTVATTGLRSEQMVQAHGWFRALEFRRSNIRSELIICQRKVELRQRELMAASQRLQSLDRLFEKQRTLHSQKLEAEQQNLLDELGTRGAWSGATFMEAI